MARWNLLLISMLLLIPVLMVSGCTKVVSQNSIPSGVTASGNNSGQATARQPTGHTNINFYDGPKTPGFEKLAADFDRMIDEGLHAGAQLAFYKDGRCVLVLAGGKDVRTGKPITQDSLFGLRSTTKELTALVMAMLYQQGLFKYDDKISKYWPEFAGNGKQDITIGQVMSHRAGIPQSIPVPVAKWTDRKAVAEGVEGLMPLWTPGTKDGYHASTYGWVSDELAMRLTGQNIAALLEKEVKHPLGIKDLYLGLPESEYYRFCPIQVLGETDGTRAAFSDFIDSYAGLKLPLAWVGGVSTARDLSNLFNIFAFEGAYQNKVFISKDTQALITSPTNSPGEEDLILKWPVRWGLGVINGLTPSIYGSEGHARAIGHAGGGANVAWADPDQHLSVVFLCNGMRTGGQEWERYRRIADLIYASLEDLK